MLTGAYLAYKKDKTPYYRASITYRNKHISLGSFDSEQLAHEAYLCAYQLLGDENAQLPDALYDKRYELLSFEKIVILLNFRDHKLYLGTPIYLMPRYFVYYLSPELELKFDNDDLFFYSNHKILKRGGHLYVNEFGMQTTILSRYGIKNYAVPGVDYQFANGDTTDYRYENIININPYYGVSKIDESGRISYIARIHINGNYQIGTYDSEIDAAIAYNKAVDMAKAAGVDKNYQQNYIVLLSPKDYAEIYTKIHISKSYREYLSTTNSK